MSKLQVSIAPVADLGVVATAGSLLADAVYTRTVSGQADPALADLPPGVVEAHHD
jgi:hypothetical protein